MKQITGKILIGLTIAVMLYSAMQVLLLTAERVRLFTKAGYAIPTRLFALFDIMLILLFAIPATRRAGFILSACYYSAGLATRMIVHESIAESMLILVLLFTTMWFTDRKIFIPRKDS